MFIGLLDKIKSTYYTHEGVDVPFPPSSVNETGASWAWNYAYDSAIDAHYELDGECFIGAVTVKLSENSVVKVEILVDGKVCGSHTAETGKNIGGEITVPVGMKGSHVTVRLHTWLLNLTLSGVQILGAYDDERPLVYPTPKAIEFPGGFVKIKDVISKNGDADEIYAAEFLKERLTESFGEWKSTRGAVIVFDKKASKSYTGERYTVKTVRGKITVAAASRLTLLYGADTVFQLYDAKRGVRKANCDDKPSKEFRGFHAGLPQLHQFEFMRRLFRYVLVPMRYNTLFVQVSGCMRFDKHPEITEAWAKTIEGFKRGELPTPPHIYMLAMGDILEKDDVRRYVGYARELGLEIIPEVQSLGHVQYITIAHPELAEIEETEVVVKDTRDEDARPATVYHHCYCPSLKESFDIIFDIIDEVIDVIKPERYVHIGHDEVYQFGVCKRCREKDPGELFAYEVNTLHDYLAKKGLGTMMWADMLQPAPLTRYKTYTAIDKLAKDIVMLDFIWYFHFDKDLEDNLLEKKFTTAIGNLYSSHFPRYRSRVMKQGMIGGEISTWLENSEEVYGNNGKLWDLIYLSEMLWNIENYDERNRRTYNEIISKYIQPKLRDAIRAKISAKGYKETKIALPKGADAPAELKAICPKAITLGSEKISVGGKFERLVIEHATVHTAPRIVWIPISKIGDYILTYSDGTTLEIPVKYAENIMAYDTAYGEPMPQQFYRHNGYVGTWFADPTYSGKSASGDDLTVYGFVFENPNPDKEIESIEYRPIENDYCGLILAGIRGLNKKI